VFFGNVVAIPGWNFDDDLAGFLDGCLAAEARVELEVGGGVEFVGFVVFHLRNAISAFLNPHVASRACAIAAAGVVEMDAIVDGDVEERFFLAVVLVGKLAVFRR